MYKPLSEKSLERLYHKISLPEEDIDLVHRYLLCFSNLYGLMEIKDAYDIYKHYEKDNALPYTRFNELIKIIQREEQPYAIVDMNEIYSGEPEGLIDYLINRKLINRYHFIFRSVYYLDENQYDKPFYMPDKEELFKHETDQFWLSESGIKMKSFIDNLTTTGIFDNSYIKETIYDLDGNPTKGKKLKDFHFYTHFEQSIIEYEKRSFVKEYLSKKYDKTASEKIMKRIEDNLRIGSGYNQDFNEQLEWTIKYIVQDCGVNLSIDNTKEFVELYIELNNKSSLWKNRGYSPDELRKQYSNESDSVPIIQIGSNMQRMLEEEGTYGQMLDFLNEKGVHVIDNRPIDLDRIIDAILDNSIDNSLYYSKKLNQIVYVDKEKMDEFDDLFEDLISLPDQYDINEYQMMKDFSYTVEDEKTSNSLLISLKGTGAFSRFREMLDNYDLLDRWYDFKIDRYRDIAIDWCKKHNIVFNNDN